MPKHRARRHLHAAGSTGEAQKSKTGSVSSNWLALKKRLRGQREEIESGQPAKNRKRVSREPAREEDPVQSRKTVKREFGLEDVVALDCEMVTVNIDGHRRPVAARIAVVDGIGDVLLDTYALPPWPVLDYLTHYSGIRPRHLKGAPPLAEIRTQVKCLLENKLVVGHALSNDFEALGIEHPAQSIRDTAKYPPLMVGSAGERLQHGGALRTLARNKLHMEIQNGEHNPVEDARAALYLYHNHKEEWEGKAEPSMQG